MMCNSTRPMFGNLKHNNLNMYSFGKKNVDELTLNIEIKDLILG